MWDIIKFANIRAMGGPEGEARERERKNVKREIMSENFPHLIKSGNLRIYEAP